MKTLVTALILVVTSALADSGKPADYKMDHYRSPVPDTLEGATVVDDDAAYALWKAGVVFVDVLPKPPKPKLPEGTIFREKPRNSIPGSIWLPNIGYGKIAEETAAYFRDNLAEAVGGDTDRPVVFFCLRDCWMSWNAAKRAMADYGYTRVFWYPDGTDGWEFNDYPTEKVTPVE